MLFASGEWVLVEAMGRGKDVDVLVALSNFKAVEKGGALNSGAR